MLYKKYRHKNTQSLFQNLIHLLLFHIFSNFLSLYHFLTHSQFYFCSEILKTLSVMMTIAIFLAVFADCLKYLFGKGDGGFFR